MATRESRGMGMAHLTVVPENLEIEPGAEDAVGEETDADEE